MERIAPNKFRIAFLHYRNSPQDQNVYSLSLRNEISHINTTQTRLYLQMIFVVPFSMNPDVTGVMDIGTGVAQLKEITDFSNLEVEERIGDDTERLDNKADVLN